MPGGRNIGKVVIGLTPVVVVVLVVLSIFTGLIVFNGEIVIKVNASKTIYVINNSSSIQSAIDNASDGDTIFIWADTYYENVVVNKSVSLIGNGSDETIIDAGGVGNVVIITADWVNISGFKIINSDNFITRWCAGITLNNVNNVSIKNNYCYNNLEGIKCTNSESIIIQNNMIISNKNHGMRLDKSNQSTISNNTIQNNNNCGILLISSHFNKLKNNTCINNAADGLQIHKSDYIELIDNYCSFNEFNGICVPFSNHSTIINNTCNSNIDNGILLNEASFNNISNNTCNNNSFNGIRTQFSSNYNLFKNNSCKSNKWIGISIEESSNNNIIEQNYCNNSYGGIGSYSTSKSNVIRKNSCLSNQAGIIINDSKSNYIIKNNCNFNKVIGIASSLNFNNIIEDNTCNSNYRFGISLDMASSNIVKNNTCTSNIEVDIRLAQSSSITILNNRMNSRGLTIFGLVFDHFCTHNIDTSNTVDDKPIYYWRDRSAGTVPTDAGQIFLANCENVCIENQNIQNRNESIGIYYSNSIIVRNNTIKNNFFGIFSYFSNDNKIYDNSCNKNINFGIHNANSPDSKIFNNSLTSNEMFGLAIQYSDDCSIIGNNLSNNGGTGMLLKTCDKCEIENNQINNNNNYHGILFNRSNGNTIKNNIISNNGVAGIKLNNSNNNRIYYNSIIDNNIQAFEMGASNYNRWDNGDDEGNYWSDYSGLDNGANDRIAGDGIGDTKIPHLGLDLYPFMNNTGWFKPGIPYLNDPGDHTPDGNFTVTWDRCRGATRYTLEEDTSIEFLSPITIYNGTKQFSRVYYKENGTFYYRLKVYSECFESVYSNIVNIIVDWPPNPPKNLSITSHPKGNVLNIYWETTTHDIEIYEIYYKRKHMDVWEFLATVLHPISNYTHYNLDDGIEYLYKIQSKDRRGQYSRFSEIVSGIPQDITPPAPPKGLKIINVTNASIGLTWQANSEHDLDGYNIYRYTTAVPDEWGDLVGTIPATNITFTDFIVKDQTTYFYVITAFDEVPNESKFSNVVSGTTNMILHPPKINNSILDFDMDEDTVDNSTINLYNWFLDLNNDPLDFNYNGGNHFNVTINQQTGNVTLMPNEHWHGSEILIFYASDGIFHCSDDVLITVNPVNDPPEMPKILEPDNNSKIFTDEMLNFSCFCHDVDLPEDDLTFQWFSDIQGHLGNSSNLTGIIMVFGIHNITLIVTDLENATSSTTILISVLESIPPTTKKDSDENYSLLIISGFLILVILIFLIIIYNKLLKKTKTTASGLTTSRFSFLSLKVSEQPEDNLENNKENIDEKSRGEK
jgi:parallel beta-helix repeat protein